MWHRPAFRAAPKAELPKAIHEQFLVGTDDVGGIVLGLVVVQQFWEPELTKGLQAVSEFVKGREGTGGTITPEQVVKLEVFLPPDAIWTQSLPSLEGVSVEWFQWVPVDEHTVTVTALPGAAQTKAPESATDSGMLVALLQHLKWFVEVAESAPGVKPPIGWAFRIYSAAVRLQFHLAFAPVSAGDTDETRAKKFASAIADLVEVGTEVTKPLRTAKGLASASDTTIRRADRDRLTSAVRKLLKQASKAGLVAEVVAARNKDFESAPNVAEMLRDLHRRGWGTEAAAQAAEAALDAEPEYADLCRAVAGVVAARSDAVTKSLRPAALAAAQEMSTSFLKVAIENLPKRHKELGKLVSPLAKALTAADAQASPDHK